MIKINYSVLPLFLSSALTFAGTTQIGPEKAALEFNRWYLDQIQDNKYPLDGHEIEKYVTADTLQNLLKIFAQEVRTGDALIDADPFTQSQDILEDWPTNITVISNTFEHGCQNVYVAFGKSQKYVLADCMVKEDGVWKVKSVTQISSD
ncbi:DUF3828 domain-containing protein [Atlantibacter sp. RC6]|uniref:DUF3828 domain-containing protein n=1 Tax=Atlantibacter sp. RC6 TaxID=2587036 RepID=UPI0016059D04|nr:DUF3828 domain-containing protein [Atlantibacter sp. RC6]MBB3322742.1 hypothetical protein [Atlantibacter sp. RC6]